MDELRSWIALCQPVNSPQRYGNISFRKWHLMLKDVRIRPIFFYSVNCGVYISIITSRSGTYIRGSFPYWLQNTHRLHGQLIPKDQENMSAEPQEHFLSSFGNLIRIDYGTGHEFSFLCWLYCLRKLNVFSSEDYESIVLDIFTKFV